MTRNAINAIDGESGQFGTESAWSWLHNHDKGSGSRGAKPNYLSRLR